MRPNRIMGGEIRGCESSALGRRVVSASHISPHFSTVTSMCPVIGTSARPAADECVSPRGFGVWMRCQPRQLRRCDAPRRTVRSLADFRACALRLTPGAFAVNEQSLSRPRD